MATSKVPLDGGWGWFVVLGSFINQAFVIGGARSFGVIFVHLREHFDATSAAAVWAAGLTTFGLSFFCPLAGILSGRYTFRMVTSIGAIAQGLAFVIAAFGTNAYFVSFTIGVINGFAVGFLQTTSIGVVSQYFSRRSSLAMGISSAGASVGQLVVPQILRFLLDHYGYFGCMLIYGALSWNSIAASALFRPLSFYTRTGSWSAQNDPERCASGQDNGSDLDDEHILGKTTNRFKEPREVSAERTKNLDRGNMLYSGSTTMLELPEEVDEAAPNEANGIQTTNGTSPSPRRALFDPEFTRNPRFWLYCVVIFLANPTVHNMVLFLPPYAREIHLSKKQASFLLSVSGISDLVGKLAGGFFNDLQLIPTRHFLAIVLSVLCGISLLCLSLPSYASMMVMVIVLGALGGIYVGLNPIHLLEITGPRKFFMAINLAVAIHAVSSLGTPLTAAIVADITGSFSFAYWLCLAMMGSGALLIEMESLLIRQKNRRRG